MRVRATVFFQNLPVALATATLWVLCAFGVGRRVRRHATIDVFWGIGFLVLYLECLVASRYLDATAPSPWSLAHGQGGRVAVLVALAAWSLRLSGHLAWRQRGTPEDSRYVMIMRGAKGRNETLYALRTIYLVQALLLWFVSIPLQWVAFRVHFGDLLVVALAVVLLGVGVEATGDEQLRRFVRDPATAGTTLDRGLWRYTRHPNYFGDALVWAGFYLCAASSGWGWLTMASPVTMWWLLTSLSGKPLLEAKLTRTRAGYAEYVARTSSFVPWPPRRGSPD